MQRVSPSSVGWIASASGARSADCGTVGGGARRTLRARRTCRGRRSRASRCGDGDRFTVATLDAIAAALGARVDCRLSWNGEALDRLLDREPCLDGRAGRPHPPSRRLARRYRGVVQRLRRARVDRRARVSSSDGDAARHRSQIGRAGRPGDVGRDRPQGSSGVGIAHGRGWHARRVWRLLVVNESRTSRRRVDGHAHTFDAQLPARAREIRRALREPALGPARLGGVWFLSDDTQPVTRHRVPAPARS